MGCYRWMVYYLGDDDERVCFFFAFFDDFFRDIVEKGRFLGRWSVFLHVLIGFLLVDKRLKIFLIQTVCAILIDYRCFVLSV